MAHRCPRNSSWKCFSASCPTSSRAKRNCASCGARRIHAQNFCKDRSEEHTSELQSQSNLVCRLLLEKKKKHQLHGEARLRFDGARPFDDRSGRREHERVAAEHTGDHKSHDVPLCVTTVYSHTITHVR